MVRSIGADYAIDYTREDFAASGQQYDLIFDAVGNRSVSDLEKTLKPDGVCAIAGFTSLSRLFQIMVWGRWVSRRTGKEIGMMDTVHTNTEDLLFLRELLDAGKIVPVIDRCYPLNETAEAVRYLEKGHARGKVVILVEGDEQAK